MIDKILVISASDNLNLSSSISCKRLSSASSSASLASWIAFSSISVSVWICAEIIPFSKGACGVDEYNSMHSSDFDDARDQIQSFLLNDYPDNAYDYNEDQKAIVEEKNRVKQDDFVFEIL